MRILHVTPGFAKNVFDAPRPSSFASSALGSRERHAELLRPGRGLFRSRPSSRGCLLPVLTSSALRTTNRLLVATLPPEPPTPNLAALSRACKLLELLDDSRQRLLAGPWLTCHCERLGLERLDLLGDLLERLFDRVGRDRNRRVIGLRRRSPAFFRRVRTLDILGVENERVLAKRDRAGAIAGLKRIRRDTTLRMSPTWSSFAITTSPSTSIRPCR